MRQHLGVEDAARRGDESAEILLPVESVAKPDALRGKVLSRNARTLIGSDLHALPVFARSPGAVEFATGVTGLLEDLVRTTTGDGTSEILTGDAGRGERAAAGVLGARCATPPQCRADLPP